MATQLDKVVRAILDAEHAAELLRDVAKLAGDKGIMADLDALLEHLKRARVEAIGINLRMSK